jgi:GNAT superfamily N-acetyltransferase
MNDLPVTVPSPVCVHRAMAADVPRLAPLFEAYRAFYGRSPDLAGARRFLEARQAAGESTVLIATVDAQESAPVGFAQLYPTFSSLSMTSIEVLNDLFVVPGWRRAGVARALLASAIEHARTRGATAMELSTSRSNAPALALYHTLGFRVDDKFARMELPLRMR